METICSSETFVNYRTTWRYNPEDSPPLWESRIQQLQFLSVVPKYFKAITFSLGFDFLFAAIIILIDTIILSHVRGVVRD
jgi:hypothetical protein